MAIANRSKHCICLWMTKLYAAAQQLWELTGKGEQQDVNEEPSLSAYSSYRVIAPWNLLVSLVTYLIYKMPISSSWSFYYVLNQMTY